MYLEPRDPAPSGAPSLSAFAPPSSARPRDEFAIDYRRFAEGVTPHLPAMLRAARSILGGEDLAWDAVQETLLRIWVRGWQLPADPERVLVSLTMKSGLHLRRCLKRRRHHEAAAGDSESPCCDEHPLAALEGEDEAEAVREVVRGLTEEYRRVVELYELQGESYATIAKRLDIPVGTVRSRLNRGRALLRERLGGRLRTA